MLILLSVILIELLVVPEVVLIECIIGLHSHHVPVHSVLRLVVIVETDILLVEALLGWLLELWNLLHASLHHVRVAIHRESAPKQSFQMKKGKFSY